MAPLHNDSYLAGLVDGEGSIGVYASSQNGKPRTRFTIEVKMTTEHVIDWLKETYGGQKCARPSKNPKWKDQRRWRLEGGKAVALYARLKPLLKIKNTL
jgi:hypothetical protein